MLRLEKLFSDGAESGFIRPLLTTYPRAVPAFDVWHGKASIADENPVEDPIDEDPLPLQNDD